MMKKISRILIYAGAALLLVAAGLMINNRVQDNKAGQRAQELLEQMLQEQREMASAGQEGSQSPDAAAQGSGAQGDKTLAADDAGADGGAANSNGNSNGNGSSNSGNNGSSDGDADAASGGTDTDAAGEAGQPAGAAVGASGSEISKRPAPTYSTIGILEIPTLSLQLPVLSECSNALLNVSICKLAGSCDAKPKRLVIAGHNLRSHFGGLKTLSVGDEVYFTTKDMTTYHYTVAEIGECHRENPEVVQEGDGWDMTLVTCQNIRTLRTLIRCRELPDEL